MTANTTTRQATNDQAKSAPAVRVPLVPGLGPAPATPTAAPGTVASLQAAAGNRAVAGALAAGPVIQRKCAGCASGGDTCSSCAEEAELVQRSPADGAPRGPAPSGLPASVVSALASGSGRGLDGGTRAFMESRFGQGFGHVRLHTDEGAARAADAIDASAFTVGSSVWFGRGQYQPERPEGLRLLAHELTHTLQQRGRAPSAQASLRVGSHNDASESLADRAADAVMAHEPLPRLGLSSAVIRRAPKVSPVAGRPDQRIVNLDDGSRHRVTRRIDWASKPKKVLDDPVQFGAKISKERVWLQLDYCKETREARVQVGANVPAAAAALVRDMVINGTPPLDALKSAEVEPFISVAVAKSRQYEVTVEPTVKVKPGQGEVTGGGIKGRIKLPGGWEGSIEGSVNKPPEGSGRTGPDIRGEAKLEWKFGEGPKKVQCKTVTREEWEPTVTFSCERLVPEHEEDRKKPVPKIQGVYLYFKYAEAVWADKKSEPGTRRNPASMAALKQLLGDGWQVTEVKGFASPEGPEDAGPRFIGNKALSQKRAEAAFDFLKANCPATTPMLDMRPGEDSCFAKGLVPQGGGELYAPPRAPGEPEAKGKKLAQHVVGEFSKVPDAGPDPEGVHRGDVAEEVEKRKGSAERQADAIYPLLRRAEVSLAKTVMEPYKVTVPDKWEPEVCLSEARAAAAEDFAKAPFPKPPEKKK